MKIDIDIRLKENFANNYNIIIQSVIEETLKRHNMAEPWEVSVSVVEASEMCAINKRFRNLDKDTDVLSFPLLEPENIVYNIQEPCLGDIVVCFDRVMSQAKEYGHGIERELGFLVAHGMLHLLGYDHEAFTEEETMRSQQEAILNAVGLAR